MDQAYLSRDEVRLVDRRAVEEYGLCSLVLMENAGRGVVDVLIELGVRGPVVVCCGLGNNGGDGLVIARHLDLRRARVTVVVCLADGTGAGGDEGLLDRAADQMAPDARANFQILRKAGAPIVLASDAAAVAEQLRGAEWVVDALLGTGARGQPRPPLDAIIGAINDSRVPVAAVDLPSGLDCDSGVAAPATIRAEHTCTFVAPKLGFRAPCAREWTGMVHVVDIGAPRKLVDEILRASSAAHGSQPGLETTPNQAI